MFQSARVRLTLITVAIAMVVSALFSVAIYHIASRELENAGQRQYSRLRRAYNNPAPFPRAVFGSEQDVALRHLFLNLVYLNLVILVLSTGIGAYLAHETLEPIERAMELQGQFAADASHELRTPLTAMRSEIEVALRQKQISAPEARELLQSNLEELAKLEGLASGLLQLAQLESAEPHYEAIAIVGVVIGAINGIKPTAKQRHVTIEHKGKDFKVKGDQGSLEQVIKILLDNAIKYGKDGGQVVVLTKTSGHKGIVEVRDEGPGIKEADLENVFERFWRANAARSKQQAEGYGLGLAIAREIVHLHNGEIRAQNHPGGASFVVELPLG